MGCASSSGGMESGIESGTGKGGGAVGEMKVRLGDKLFERRDRCVQQFARDLFKRIHEQIDTRSSRKRIKDAYDDGVLRLFGAEASPTTHLFLQRSEVKDRITLVAEPPSSKSTDTKSTTSGGGVTVDLLQFGQVEEDLTRPLSAVHGLGVFLQPPQYKGSTVYGVWIAWHKQQPDTRVVATEPRKLRLNEGLLNTTIQLGPFDQPVPSPPTPQPTPTPIPIPLTPPPPPPTTVTLNREGQ